MYIRSVLGDGRETHEMMRENNLERREEFIAELNNDQTNIQRKIMKKQKKRHIGKQSFRKYKNFMKLFHKRGGDQPDFIWYESYLLFRNVRAETTHYQVCQTIHFSKTLWAQWRIVFLIFEELSKNSLLVAWVMIYAVLSNLVFVAKFLCRDFCNFSADFLWLKSRLRKLFRF